MEKKNKLGRIVLIALALSAIPYDFKKDENGNIMKIRSLLWAWKKTPNGDGEGKYSYSFSIPPSGLDHMP